MTKRSAILLPALVAAAAAAQSIPYPMMRDHILEIAHDHYALRWYCSAENLYEPRDGARCDYTVVGWKSGMAYKWGGYDTVPSFLTGLAAGKGAGDVDSSAVVSWTCGDDCSGYVSRCWKSGRYSTASFPNISTPIAWEQLSPGDALNRPRSHIRLFDQFVGGFGLVLVYETTTGVDPGRTTHRVLTQAQHSNYTPIRYNHVYDIPSLVAARAQSPARVVLHWLGAAGEGFRLCESMDGAVWTRVRDTDTLGPQTMSATIPMAPGEGATRLYRVASVTGGVESAPSVAFPVTPPDGRERILVVYGFDRAIYLFGGTGHTHMRGIASALDAAGWACDTVDNLLVQRWGDPADGGLVPAVDLAAYGVVVWVLGTESTAHVTLNRRERKVLTDYLEGGGSLLMTGAELGWDLVERKELQEEEDFFHEVLKTGYVHDNAGTRAVTGRAGTIFAGLSFSFDDGSHGTYAVNYPDVFSARGGSMVCLDYVGGRGGAAGILYEGPIAAGTETARIVHLGFPIETVYDDAARAALLQRSLAFLTGRRRTSLETY